ncbi:MAG: phenylalanine--tRNA ligase subunit beta, partial [Betaproteobacteria bacterium]|nr:phenylalanine--tRNA ligase subunit beta [Betaproteobacteria bacterium]
SGVVVAQVMEVSKHPDADRLRVCKVDCGEAQPLQIVCGAPNVAAGMKVPCARIGAELPAAEPGAKAFRIGAARMRGVDSQGMLCSARELGLSADHSGLLELDAGLPVGQDVREALRLDEQVLGIKLTPNLGHCMSVYGVARELSAVTGAPLQRPGFEPVAPQLQETLPVAVQAPDLCGRFSGRVIRGVDARAQTPAWLRQRLERAGQRSISALVDISNYVMLELGRPTHVFDLDRIDGGLEVRWGRTGESLELLNGQTIEVDERVGVIAAGKGIESLAGIMGGEATAVSLDTRNVYVEAAFWWPQAIRGRARRYNFSTDAGARFERGVDYATTVEHLQYITRLIVDICGGQAGPVDDRQLRLPERAPVRMRVARCERIIGTPIGADAMAAIFARLGLPAQREAQGTPDEAFIVTPPSYRFDLEIEEDLVEEVARIHGYANIPVRPPLAEARMLAAPEGRRSQHALRLALVERGYQETIQFSFAEPEWESDLQGNAQPIALRNPISAQASVMRSGLLGGLLQTLRANLSHKARRVRIFELGRVFLRAPERQDLAPRGVEQPMRIGGLAYGPVWPIGWAAPERMVDFHDVKADVEQL